MKAFTFRVVFELIPLDAIRPQPLCRRGGFTWTARKFETSWTGLGSQSGMRLTAFMSVHRGWRFSGSAKLQSVRCLREGQQSLIGR